MSVTLIAAVVALVLGHLAPSLAASVRHYGWYADWLRWLGTRFAAGSPWHGRWGIALALVPPVLAVGVFQLALDEPLYGLAGLLLGIAVLFYSWGPRDLDVDVNAIVDADDALSRRRAAAALWPHGATPSLDGGALVGAVFESALRRWFGVLFWFLLLGPVGALLYRLAAVSADGDVARSLPSENAAGARTLLAVLDWPVAQLMSLSLALVGNFDTALGAWRDAGAASLTLDHRFLAAAARASVRVELAEEAQDEEIGMPHGGNPAGGSQVLLDAADMPELRDAMSLVWRSLLVWLAVLALFVIAGWVS